MRVILQSEDDLVGQAKAAQYAISKGAPEGRSRRDRFRYIVRGDDEYAVVFNKSSVTVYPQKKNFVQI